MNRPARRLDTVLRVRRVQEEQAAAQLAGALAAVREQERLLAQREDALRRPWTDRAVVELAYAAVDEAEARLEEAGIEAESRRALWSAAAQRARAIERFVENQREAARKEALRVAAIRLDDLAVVQAARKAQGR